ncbi:MAG: hypothetical protein D6732_06620 [Methanobacteriota archaeon]|nr:MAG: hypothetical protein D6732_06620 [Euryarchaeota archaeon]
MENVITEIKDKSLHKMLSLIKTNIIENGKKYCTKQNMIDMMKKADIDKNLKFYLIQTLDDFINFSITWGILFDYSTYYEVNEANVELQLSLEETT